MTSATNRVFAFLFAALLSAAVNLFWVGLGFGVTFTSFGPRLYERGTGNPAPVVISFAASHLSKAYSLKIYNGGRAGIRTGERVSGAMISLNSAVIAGPQNINQKIGELSFPSHTTLMQKRKGNCTLPHGSQLQSLTPAMLENLAHSRRFFAF